MEDMARDSPEWMISEELEPVELSDFEHEETVKLARLYNASIIQINLLRQQVSQLSDVLLSVKDEGSEAGGEARATKTEPNIVDGGADPNQSQPTQISYIRIVKAADNSIGNSVLLEPMDGATEKLRTKAAELEREFTELMKTRQNKMKQNLGSWRNHSKKTPGCIRQKLRGQHYKDHVGTLQDTATSVCRICFNRRLLCVRYRPDADAYVVVPLPKQVAGSTPWNSYERFVYVGAEMNGEVEKDHGRIW